MGRKWLQKSYYLCLSTTSGCRHLDTLVCLAGRKPDLSRCFLFISPLSLGVSLHQLSDTRVSLRRLSVTRVFSTSTLCHVGFLFIDAVTRVFSSSTLCHEDFLFIDSATRVFSSSTLCQEGFLFIDSYHEGFFVIDSLSRGFSLHRRSVTYSLSTHMTAVKTNSDLYTHPSIPTL